jgi:hypothetical protein
MGSRDEPMHGYQDQPYAPPAKKFSISKDKVSKNFQNSQDDLRNFQEFGWGNVSNRPIVGTPKGDQNSNIRFDFRTDISNEIQGDISEINMDKGEPELPNLKYKIQNLKGSITNTAACDLDRSHDELPRRRKDKQDQYKEGYDHGSKGKIRLKSQAKDHPGNAGSKKHSILDLIVWSKLLNGNDRLNYVKNGGKIIRNGKKAVYMNRRRAVDQNSQEKHGHPPGHTPEVLHCQNIAFYNTFNNDRGTTSDKHSRMNLSQPTGEDFFSTTKGGDRVSGLNISKDQIGGPSKIQPAYRGNPDPNEFSKADWEFLERQKSLSKTYYRVESKGPGPRGQSVDESEIKRFNKTDSFGHRYPRDRKFQELQHKKEYLSRIKENISGANLYGPELSAHGGKSINVLNSEIVKEDVGYSNGSKVTVPNTLLGSSQPLNVNKSFV